MDETDDEVEVPLQFTKAVVLADEFAVTVVVVVTMPVEVIVELAVTVVVEVQVAVTVPVEVLDTDVDVLTVKVDDVVKETVLDTVDCVVPVLCVVAVVVKLLLAQPTFLWKTSMSSRRQAAPEPTTFPYAPASRLRPLVPSSTKMPSANTCMSPEVASVTK